MIFVYLQYYRLDLGLTSSCALAAWHHYVFPEENQPHLTGVRSCEWPHLGPAAKMTVWGSVECQWARPAEKNKKSHTSVHHLAIRYLWINVYNQTEPCGDIRKTAWLIASTGKSTKPDKQATFPKPFLYFSIALQQMHKVMSCKAQTKWSAVNGLIRY